MIRRRDLIRNAALGAASLPVGVCLAPAVAPRLIPPAPVGGDALTGATARRAYTLDAQDGDLLVLEGIFPAAQLRALRERFRLAGKDVVIVTIPCGRASVERGGAA